MGAPYCIRLARLEKWAVSRGGLRTGCFAVVEDGVTETRGGSPQSFRLAGRATQTFPWAEPPLYRAPTSLNGRG
jgi:hypothetical protein